MLSYPGLFPMRMENTSVHRSAGSHVFSKNNKKCSTGPRLPHCRGTMGFCHLETKKMDLKDGKSKNEADIRRDEGKEGECVFSIDCKKVHSNASNYQGSVYSLNRKFLGLRNSLGCRRYTTQYIPPPIIRKQLKQYSPIDNFMIFQAEPPS